MEKYKALFDLVSTGKMVEWEKMGTVEDGYCYDEIKLGDEAPFKFRAGEENFIGDLVAEFPSEEKAIKEYVRLCKRANKSADMYFYGKMFPKFIQRLLNKYLNAEYFGYVQERSERTLSEHVKFYERKPRSLICNVRTHTFTRARVLLDH